MFVRCSSVEFLSIEFVSIGFSIEPVDGVRMGFGLAQVASPVFGS